MGHRLTKIYTRTGDAGTTGLGDGSRVAKNSARVEALGAVDELNSCLGVLLAEPLGADLQAAAHRDPARPVRPRRRALHPGLHRHPRRAGHADWSRRWITTTTTLEPLKEFILPGGSRAAALCHLARTVCRRAERQVVGLASSETVSPYCQQYLNRLSDLLFVVSRVLNRRDGQGDVLWRRGRTDRLAGRADSAPTCWTMPHPVIHG